MVSLAYPPTAEVRPVSPDKPSHTFVVDEEVTSEALLEHDELRRPTSAIARSYRRFEEFLGKYQLEARGIRRVEIEERHDLNSLGYAQVGLLWFSMNLAAQNITLGMLGPAVFYLSFLDAAICSVCGVFIGALPVAHVATFGPKSGCRSIVLTRYFMGWWPTKIIAVLNIIVFLGYATIDAVLAGQLISAVSTDASVSIFIGIIIAAVITLAISSLGYSILHQYERYAWIPQLMMFCILAGVAGPRFALSTPTTGSPSTRVAGRMSYLSICISAAITYAVIGTDYLVYYPEQSSRRKIFLATMVGLLCSFTMALLIGVGLGTGIRIHKDWADAYDISQGALIVQGFAPLGAFGKFCSVIVALGLIANLIPCTYSSGVDIQTLGRYFAKVPRLVWNSLAVVVFTVCALVGRDHLAEVFTNFLALMGYWVSIWVAIFLEEHFIFRSEHGFNWTIWNVEKQHPVGIAATLAFLAGWAGAIISMAQLWYTGPVASLVGDYGADMGNYFAFVFGAVVFAPLRYLELRKLGR